MYKICFLVPIENAETVKIALFEAGAGCLGNYEHCAWQTLGVGQFKPKAGSKPFIGEGGKLEKVDEIKVEMICSDECIKDAIIALKKAHPYEEPVYDVWNLESF